jgi:hypothetical protein
MRAALSGRLDCVDGPGGDLVWGDELLLRYRYRDGSLQAALPLRVVEDSPTRVVGWLAEGTEITYWALDDGTDPRSVPLEERFTRELTTARRTWEGGGVLRVILAGRPFQVLHFWGASGDFAGWYVNFEKPTLRTGNRVDTVDWHLDLWIEPDGSTRWKDEDEADAALAAGHLTAEDRATARATGAEILADFESFLLEVGDWRAFEPPTGWASLRLPDDWAS